MSLVPGPGLTLVVGRNGSGKSSFAEALEVLEVLLTGDLRRWEKLSAVWHQGWRSMHQSDKAEITAEFLVEGAGPAVVQRTWPAGAAFAQSSESVQYKGEKRAGLERLEWSQALADYRPFLSHSELEAFFGSPSGLYELLASVLGLEDLTLAAARLAAARKARESALNEVGKQLPALLDRLESADDERAAACRKALAGKPLGLGPGCRPIGRGQCPRGSRWRRPRPAWSASAAGRGRGQRGIGGAPAGSDRPGDRRWLASRPAAGAGRASDRGPAAPQRPRR